MYKMHKRLGPKAFLLVKDPHHSSTKGERTIAWQAGNDKRMQKNCVHEYENVTIYKNV